MRVLVAIAALGTGGAERVVLALADGLVGAGDDVAVIAAPGNLDAELNPAVARWALVDRARSPLGLAAGSVAMAHAVRAWRPDVVHAHNVRATALALAGARLARPLRPPPVLATYHGVAPEEEAQAVRILARAAAITCVSEGLATRVRAAGTALPPTAVVANPIVVPPPWSPEDLRALERELGLDPGTPVVAAVCRLAAQKALHRLLEAMPGVLERMPGTRLLIVGEGPLRGELEARAAQLGVAGNVTFTGRRSDARLILERTDVLAISSDWEGQPIVALEALVAGVPIVSTAVDGMVELLAGGAGTIVGVGDVGALSVAIGDVIADPELRGRMGAAGRDVIATRHAPRAVVSAYRALYAGLTRP